MKIRDWLSIPKRLFDLEIKVHNMGEGMVLANEKETRPEMRPRGATMEPFWLRAGAEVSIGRDNYWLATDTPVFGEKVYELERWGLLAEGEPRVEVGDLALALGDQVTSLLIRSNFRRPQPRKVVEVMGDYARLEGAIVFEPMRTLRVVERAEDGAEDSGGGENA